MIAVFIWTALFPSWSVRPDLTDLPGRSWGPVRVRVPNCLASLI